MTGAFRLYGIFYLALAIFLITNFLPDASLESYQVQPFLIKASLPYFIILGTLLFVWPRRIYRFAASPLWIILIVISTYILFNFIIPAILSLALAIFELIVLLMVI